MGFHGYSVLGMVRSRPAFRFHSESLYIAIFSAVVIKIMLGVNLVIYATKRRAKMEERAAADTINDFGRNPVGEGREEQVS